jgi:ABC-type lipoprotein release transport system permease subunit
MILSLRMAWRNLWRNQRRTWLTATAMIFSNILLVFMISLQLGSYDMMIDNTLRSFSGHIQVQQKGYQENPKLRSSIDGISSLSEQIRGEVPAAAVAARATGFALVSSEQRSLGIQVVGVQPDYESGVSTFPGLVAEGRFLQDESAAEIVIGAVLARNLKAGIGDELTLLGSGRDGSFAAGVVTIVGIFDSGSPDVDRSLAEVPLRYFQETFTMGSHGNAIVVAVDTLKEIPAALDRINGVIRNDENLTALDWTLLQPGLKQAIQADFSSAWFMYGVLIILVAFSVMNTQLMSVLERTREFGVVTALGIKPIRLASLVMLETALMALIGLVIGLLLGWLVTAYFNHAGFTYPGMEEVAGKFNLSARMYPEMTPLSLVLGPSVVFVFCLLAAIYPSLRLFRLQPVKAMSTV